MIVAFYGFSRAQATAAWRARVTSLRSLFRCLRNVVSNTIRPFFVNLYVILRAVGPSENRSSKSPSPRLLDNGILAVEPSAANRSITTTVRSHSAPSSERIQTTTSSWSSKSDTP